MNPTPSDIDLLRRASAACRNFKEQAEMNHRAPTEWFSWVAPALERLADDLTREGQS